MEALNQDNNTLTHITHLHPLHLEEVNDTASPPTCHACGFPCTDSSIYRCGPCSYVMHVACARAAKTLQHAADPDHPLSFRLAPPPGNSSRVCDACKISIEGPSFRCEPCEFDLHLPCAALPATVTVSAHAHPLKLAYEDPFKGNAEFPSLCFCDLCSEGCTTEQWFYWCEGCDFEAHVGCAVPDTPAKPLYPVITEEEIEAFAAEAAEAAKAEAAAAEAAKTAALLQQYQQMSALISAQSSVFARNTASIAAGMQSLSIGASMSDRNREINFNTSRTDQKNRKR